MVQPTQAILPIHKDSSNTKSLSRYVVQSTDVISDMRVNVQQEGSEKVVWYKERFLTDDEIVDHVYDNATTRVCWTIHRPKRGWYIRIRSPSFPPGVYVALMPVPKSSPYYTEASLFFPCRTNIPRRRPLLAEINTASSSSSARSSADTDVTLSEVPLANAGAVHSYPPTPTMPSVVVEPPSPRAVQAKLRDLPTRTLNSRTRPQSQTQIAEFLMARHDPSNVPRPDQKPSLFSRALSALTGTEPAHSSSSFTLCPVPTVAPPGTSPDPSQTPPISIAGLSPHTNHGPGTHCHPHMPPPLLTFHDTTPAFTFHATTGLLEIDETEARTLGVQVSFWVAVALTYMGFLEDRDSYLAAITD